MCGVFCSFLIVSHRERGRLTWFWSCNCIVAIIRVVIISIRVGPDQGAIFTAIASWRPDISHEEGWEWGRKKMAAEGNHETINPSSSSTIIPPSVPKILFSSTNDQPASSSTTDYGFRTHPFNIQLAQNKVHIPLRLFTTYSTNKLHKESTSITQNIVYNCHWHKVPHH